MEPKTDVVPSERIDILALARMRENQAKGRNIDADSYIRHAGIIFDATKGVPQQAQREREKDLPTLDIYQRIVIAKALLERIERQEQQTDIQALQQSIGIAQFLSVADITIPFQIYIEDLTRKIQQAKIQLPTDINAENSPRPVISRRSLLLGGAALATLGALGATGLTKLAPSQQSASIGSPEKQVSPEKPESLLDELLKPFIEEAKRRRVEKRLRNPEDYDHRINTELNEGRVNFLLFGYGETNEPPADKAVIGSHTILSYDMKSRTFSIVSLTHDILAPEIQRYNEGKVGYGEPTKIDQVYQVGGLPLQGEIIENATGFVVDFQLALQDRVIRNLVDIAFDGKLPISVPFNLDTIDFYQDGQTYPASHFTAGETTLNGIRVMQFMKALASEYNPETERNIRKHLIMKALLSEAMRNKFNPVFLAKTISFLLDQEGLLETDFDMKRLLPSPLGIGGRILRNVGQSQSEETTLSIGKTMYIVDTASGGNGGVQWITASESESIRQGLSDKFFRDESLVVPAGKDINPTEADLVLKYWKPIRELIKKTLIP